MATRPYCDGEVVEILKDGAAYRVRIELDDGTILPMRADQKGARGFRVGDRVMVVAHRQAKRLDAEPAC